VAEQQVIDTFLTNQEVLANLAKDIDALVLLTKRLVSLQRLLILC
jgi:hypothetical protein